MTLIFTTLSAAEMDMEIKQALLRPEVPATYNDALDTAERQLQELMQRYRELHTELHAELQRKDAEIKRLKDRCEELQIRVVDAEKTHKDLAKMVMEPPAASEKRTTQELMEEPVLIQIQEQCEAKIQQGLHVCV